MVDRLCVRPYLLTEKLLGSINDIHGGEQEANEMKTVSPHAESSSTLPDVLLPMMNDERSFLPGCFVFERRG